MEFKSSLEVHTHRVGATERGYDMAFDGIIGVVKRAAAAVNCARLVLGVGLALATAEAAQGAPVRELSLHSDYCAILRALTDRRDPSCPTQFAGQHRSRSMGGDPQHQKAALSPGEDGFENGYFIHFAFDSAVLEPAYKAHLDRLAAVLNSPALDDTCLKLVGHTDSSGPVSYNQVLSESRAQTVAFYLGKHVTTDHVVIAAAGQGEDQPIVGYEPDAAIQRRVEVLSRHNDGACE